ncbi:MAG: GNAT family N-acetyltransferase [Candidatus Diapherotrites archaeon]|nr:GNAT family N-acetyltransferase [Candidatus Diapherotrites archaeon]
MRIKRANEEGIKEIDRLNRKYFHEKGRNWSDIAEMFVVEEKGRIIGFTGLEYHEWNNTAQIVNVFVHPKYRKRGYATKIIRFLVEYVKGKGYRSLLAEAPSMSPVLGAYLKNKFRVCGFNDRYYSNSGEEFALFLSYDYEVKRCQ